MGDTLGGITHGLAAFNHADHHRRAHQEPSQAVEGHREGIEKIDVDHALFAQAYPGPFKAEVSGHQDEARHRQGGQGEGASKQGKGQGAYW